MPVFEHGEVQTEKHDGRKFITLKLAGNGRTDYQSAAKVGGAHRL